MITMINGETLRVLRLLKKQKQSTIARKLGISQPAYSKIEKCKRIEGEKIKRILDLLDYAEEDVISIERIAKSD
jgi:transcriptional regulator with XRE-family HTH domain